MPSKRMPIPFTGQESKGKNVFLNSEECINYYPEPLKGSIILRGCPGKIERVDINQGDGKPVRAQIESAGFAWAVCYDGLFRYDTNFNVTQITGSMQLDDPVFMIENGLQIGIFGGDRAYYYTHATDTLAEITDSDFPGASSATYQDGYAIVSRPSTNQFFLSDLNDFSSWDALEFGSAAWRSDNLVRVLSDHRDLWMFCEKSTQIFYNAGTGTPPFTNMEGAEIESGCAAVNSVARGGSAVFWLGYDDEGSLAVMMSVGRQPRPISNVGITEAIEGYTTTSDAIGFTYAENNHVFYELTFPTEDITFVYDLTTNLWHRRSSIINNHAARNRISNHLFFNGKHMVGDYTNGKIYETSRDIYDEDGTVLIAQRTAPAITNNQDLITFNEIQILFGPGTGLVTGNTEDTDPHAILDWSDDGGETYGNSLDLPIGKTGEYKNRAIEYRLGQARNRVFRIRMSAAVERDIFGAFAMVEVDTA